jgi:hypothetical protein
LVGALCCAVLRWGVGQSTGAHRQRFHVCVNEVTLTNEEHLIDNNKQVSHIQQTLNIHHFSLEHVSSIIRMLSEVVNALYITYLATEYNVLSNYNGRKSRSGRSAHSDGHHYNNNNTIHDGTNVGLGNTNKRILMITIVVVIWNLFDYISGFGDLIHHLLDIIFLYHIPRIVLVATSYILTLYYDCYFAVQRHIQMHQPQVGGDHHHRCMVTKESVSILTWKKFLPRIFRYFIRILPIYPIMAVLISFIFLFVISIFEILHVSTDILNAPIYYGTLYGPFSYIYYHVKHDIIAEQSQSTESFLPQHCNQPTVKATLV